MPREHATLVLAAQRAAEARRIISDQRALIAKLRTSKLPADEAETKLQTYLSALQHIEDHERKIKEGLMAKIGKTKPPHGLGSK
jgi:hypothetical protein